MGLVLVGGALVAALGLAFGVVRWYLRRTHRMDRDRATAVALASTGLSLAVFLGVFVALLVLLAATSDQAGDAAIFQLEDSAQWLRHALRP